MPKGTSEVVRVGIVGAGAVSAFHHVPGLKLDPRAELVAACDADAGLLEKRRREWGLRWVTTEYEELCGSEELDAVIIATPNDTHRSIAECAAGHGKHVMCEKPLGLNAWEARSMLSACESADVVHMTAFTYRFAPAMRYMKHLVRTGALGMPRHFRSQRFMDLPETSWGWRQMKERAGAGDLFDMTIHRIDLALDLMGPLARISGAVAQFAKRDRTAEGKPCPASEVDDWSAILGIFQTGATGVWEGTTVALGYHLNGVYHEWGEVNGSEGSAVYRLHEPNVILLGRKGVDLHPEAVPPEFLKPSGSVRDVHEGLPSTVFRYDLAWEFVSAIVEGRDAEPSFREGLAAQVVADSVLESYETGRWVEFV
jgi:predicted dehydrogenase